MLIGQARIRELIPHSGSMCLLDAARSWDGDRIVCTATSHRDPRNPLLQDGRLGAACGVEYAAQAMALHGSLLAGQHLKPRGGMLASLRSLKLQVPTLQDRGGVLTIEAQRVLGEAARVIYEFQVTDAGTLLLSGRAAVVLDLGG